MNGRSRKISDPDFINALQEFDIIFMQETWISENTSTNLNIQDYKSHHLFGNKSFNTRKGRYSGGLSIYYKNDLQDKITIVEQNQNGILWIRISKDLFPFNEDVYVCSVYVLPQSSTVLNQIESDFFEQIENDVEKYTSLGKNLCFRRSKCSNGY